MTQPTLRQLADNMIRKLERGENPKDIAREAASELYVSKRTHLVDDLRQHIEAQLEISHRLAIVNLATATKPSLQTEKRLLHDLEHILNVSRVSLQKSVQPSLVTGLVALSAVRRVDMSGARILKDLQGTNA
jgi:F0F1-type ATP synthase delta subunit